MLKYNYILHSNITKVKKKIDNFKILNNIPVMWFKKTYAYTVYLCENEKITEVGILTEKQLNKLIKKHNKNYKNGKTKMYHLTENAYRLCLTYNDTEFHSSVYVLKRYELNKIEKL